MHLCWGNYEGIRECEQVLLGAGVVAVGHEHLDDTGRCRRHEDLGGTVRGGAQVGDVGFDQRPAGVGDRPVAAGIGHDRRHVRVAPHLLGELGNSSNPRGASGTGSPVKPDSRSVT
jgi:hypothetical protein